MDQSNRKQLPTASQTARLCNEGASDLRSFLLVLMSKVRTATLEQKAKALNKILSHSRNKRPSAAFNFILPLVLERLISRRRGQFFAHFLHVVRKTDAFISLFKSSLLAIRKGKVALKFDALFELGDHSVHRLFERVYPRARSFSLADSLDHVKSDLGIVKMLEVEGKRTLAFLLFTKIFKKSYENSVRQETASQFFRILKSAVESKLAAGRGPAYRPTQTSRTAKAGPWKIVQEYDSYEEFSLLAAQKPSKNVSLTPSMGTLKRPGTQVVLSQENVLKYSVRSLTPVARQVSDAACRSARLLGVVMEAIFAKKKRQALAEINNFVLESRKRRLKTLYPKVQHLIKPVSPQRVGDTVNSVLSNSFVGTLHVSKSQALVGQSPALTKNYSKVSMFDFNSVSQHRNPTLPEKEILVDRFVKHQALRSISRNCPRDGNIEKLTTISSQFQSINDGEAIRRIHTERAQPETHIVRQSANFGSPLYKKNAPGHLSSRQMAPQTVGIMKQKTQHTPKMFYDSYAGNAQKAQKKEAPKVQIPSFSRSFRSHFQKPGLTLSRSFQNIELHEYKSMRRPL